MSTTGIYIIIIATALLALFLMFLIFREAVESFLNGSPVSGIGFSILLILYVGLIVFIVGRIQESSIMIL